MPDIFMSHVDQRYFIEEKELEYEQTVETLLGEGSFGRVYRAKYKDRFVAAKVCGGNNNNNDNDNIIVIIMVEMIMTIIRITVVMKFEVRKEKER